MRRSMGPAMFVHAPPLPALRPSVPVLPANSEPTSNTAGISMHATVLPPCLRVLGRWRDCQTQQTSCSHATPSPTASHDQKAATAASAHKATTTVDLPSATFQPAALRNCTTHCRISNSKVPLALRQPFQPVLSCSRSTGPVDRLLQCTASRSKCLSRRLSPSITSPCPRDVPEGLGGRRRFRLEGRISSMFRRHRRRRGISVISSREGARIEVGVGVGVGVQLG